MYPDTSTPGAGSLYGASPVGASAVGEATRQKKAELTIQKKVYVPKDLVEQANTAVSGLMHNRQSAPVFLLRYATKRQPAATELQPFVDESIATAGRAQQEAPSSGNTGKMLMMTFRLSQQEWEWVGRMCEALAPLLSIDRTEKVSTSETVRAALRWSLRNWTAE